MVNICIDPGHPSYFYHTKKINWGAEIEGIREVELNLNLAQELREYLIKRGCSVILTRTNNTDVVSNRKRVEIAREFNANLFFRIHADFDRNNDFSISGIKTIHPTKKSQLIFLKSKRIAEYIHKTLIQKTMLVDRGVHDESICYWLTPKGMLEGTYWTNKFNIPTVLVETVYLSNKNDREWITIPKNQNLLTAAMGEGIYIYFKSSIKYKW